MHCLWNIAIQKKTLKVCWKRTPNSSRKTSEILETKREISPRFPKSNTNLGILWEGSSVEHCFARRRQWCRTRLFTAGHCSAAAVTISFLKSVLARQYFLFGVVAEKAVSSDRFSTKTPTVRPSVVDWPTIAHDSVSVRTRASAYTGRGITIITANEPRVSQWLSTAHPPRRFYQRRPATVVRRPDVRTTSDRQNGFHRQCRTIRIQRDVIPTRY